MLVSLWAIGARKDFVTFVHFALRINFLIPISWKYFLEHCSSFSIHWVMTIYHGLSCNLIFSD